MRCIAGQNGLHLSVKMKKKGICHLRIKPQKFSQNVLIFYFLGRKTKIKDFEYKFMTFIVYEYTFLVTLDDQQFVNLTIESVIYCLEVTIFEASKCLQFNKLL